MSLKVKLISCLSAFIIVASLMFISVFAATNVTLNIGGNVSFTASSVNAYITGNIAGNSAGGSTLTPIDIDASDNDGAVSMPSDWTAMDLTFTESASPITVTINIQNRSTDREIAVSLTDSTNILNVTVTRECDNVGIKATDSRNIPVGETVTYTFELSVQSQNSSASGAFSLAVGLENAEESYTVTVIYEANQEAIVDVAINDMQEFSSPNQIEGSEELPTSNSGDFSWDYKFYNVTRIAFGGFNSSITRAIIPSFTLTVTSDSGVNDSLYSGLYGVENGEFLGWYEITSDTVFNLASIPD